MTEQTQHKIFDPVAMEALSAGIGLGTVKARRVKRLVTKTEQPTKAQTETPMPAPPAPAPIVAKQPRRWFRTTVAYLLDLLIIGGSLLIAVGVAHFATVERLPMPAEYLFIIVNRFEPRQIVGGVLLLLIAYFILFKLLVGITLGETLAGSKANKRI